MAYLKGEPAAERVADLIADAGEQRAPLLMSVVKAGEVWYTVARLRNISDADKAIAWLLEFGIEFIDADWSLTKIAAGYKVKGNISYADSYAAALAKQNKATLVTGDPEFKQLEKEIEITWL